MADDTILETRQLTKEFKGFVAVRDVSLSIRKGTIHALIGPNGAGKTTCFNLLTHFLTPARPIFYGRETGFAAGDDRWMGLLSVPDFRRFPNLTCRECPHRVAASPWPLFDFWRSEGSRGIPHRAGIDRGRRPSYFAHARGRFAVWPQTGLEIADDIGLTRDDAVGRADCWHSHQMSSITALIRKVAVNRTVLMVEHNLLVVSRCRTISPCRQRRGWPKATTRTCHIPTSQAYMGTANA
jgi:branched-chain amino acid transport system ATP-binding protein